MNTNSFALRHIGPREEDAKEMLATIGLNTMEELIKKTIPSNIRLSNDLDLNEAMSEQEFLGHIKNISSKNKTFKT